MDAAPTTCPAPAGRLARIPTVFRTDEILDIRMLIFAVSKPIFMLKNILFVFISIFVFASCGGSGAKSEGASPFEKAKIFLADGDRHREKGEDRTAKKLYKKAVIEFENQVRKDPNVKGLASLLGESQFRIRDFDNAIQWLNKAVAEDKEDARSHQYLGYCLVNKSKIKEADASFKKAFFVDKTGKVKEEAIKELTDIGELSVSLGTNFASQGSPAQGVEFQKLGMRIMAMGLEYSKYDLDLARQIQTYAKEIDNQILIDWIANVIEGEENKTTTIILNK